MGGLLTDPAPQPDCPGEVFVRTMDLTETMGRLETAPRVPVGERERKVSIGGHTPLS